MAQITSGMPRAGAMIDLLSGRLFRGSPAAPCRCAFKADSFLNLFLKFAKEDRRQWRRSPMWAAAPATSCE